MFDNASINKIVIEKLVGLLILILVFLFRVRCVYHIFNLIMQNDMKYIKDQIDRIRNALIYIITTSSSRKKVFKEYCA